MTPNRKQRRAKPHGMSYADVLAQQKMKIDAVNAAAKDETVRIRSDVRCQRILWLCAVALHDQFGFGPERIKRFLLAVNTATDAWEADAVKDETGKVHLDYANENLRKRVEEITGMEIEQLYKTEIEEARKLHEAQGIILDPMEF